MAMDEFDFDIARRMYVDTVRKRMNLVSMRDKVVSIGVIVHEFLILTDEIINLTVSRIVPDEQQCVDEIIENLKNNDIQISEWN